MPTRHPNRAAVLLLSLAAAAVPFAAAAQDAPAPPAASAPATPGEPATAAATPEQIPLTAEAVEKFVSSWPAMEALGDEFAEAYGVDDSVTDPTSAFTAWAKQPAAKKKLDETLTKAGFPSLEEWVKVANSVVVAYSYDAAELSPERLEEIVAEIQSSPDIPDDQKAAVISQVRQGFAHAAENKPLQGNVEVVAPFEQRLAEVFGESNPDQQIAPGDDDAPADEAPPADAAPPAGAAPPAAETPPAAAPPTP